MTGPTATILLPAPAIPSTIAALIEDNFQTMEATSDRRDDQPAIAFHGLIDKRRFLITCGLEYAERFEDIDFAQLTHSLGWTPVDEVRIAAASHTPEDHTLLARVCIRIAEPLHGIIEFRGSPWLSSGQAAPSLPGTLLALRAFDAGEPISEDTTEFFCDPVFLRNWMEHPDFKMIV